MKTLIIINYLVLLGGCCNTASLERRISGLQYENNDLSSKLSSSQGEAAKLRGELTTYNALALATQRETLQQQKKNECILRHNDAKQSCDILLRGEPNSVAFQSRMLQCMSNKGFRGGMSTCQ